jgi:hypothetical protein
MLRSGRSGGGVDRSYARTGDTKEIVNTSLLFEKSRYSNRTSYKYSILSML